MVSELEGRKLGCEMTGRETKGLQTGHNTCNPSEFQGI